MNRSYFNWIILLAAACIVLVALFMGTESNTLPKSTQKPLTSRPMSPFKSYISAVGIVEASSGNIFVGSPVNRVVDKVEVKVGDKVKAGEILFRLDSKDLEADLLTRCINYKNAVANLQKLESLPRIEDVAISEALLKEAQVKLNQAASQYKSVEGLQLSGAMSLEEVNRRRFAFEEAEAKKSQAQADLNKTKSGAWKPDLEMARLQVEQARAEVQRAEADLARTVIRAPSDAQVLQIKIHAGEYPPPDPSRIPPMILGNTDEMHLRVNINQFDASFYNSKAPTVAFLQGNAKTPFHLTFVQLEPYFVTKQNLTNDITEKVDTRVLQAIYCFEEGEQRVYVGQQMDVFIETDYVTAE